MSRRYAVIAALLITVIWWLYDTYQDNQRLKADNTVLNSQLSAQQAINTTMLSDVVFNHRVSLDNINVRNIEGTEHVKVKAVIKTVFKDSECAVTPVPADAVNELRKYATEINTRVSGSDTSATDH